MLDTIRLMTAETFLGWALAILPKGHPDSLRMAQAIRAYLAPAVEGQDHPRANSRATDVRNERQ